MAVYQDGTWVSFGTGIAAKGKQIHRLCFHPGSFYHSHPIKADFANQPRMSYSLESEVQQCAALFRSSENLFAVLSTEAGCTPNPKVGLVQSLFHVV